MPEKSFVDIYIYKAAVEAVRMQAQAIPDPRAEEALQLIERRDYAGARNLIEQLDQRLQLPLYRAAFFHIEAAYCNEMMSSIRHII